MVDFPARKDNYFFSRKATKQHWVKAKYNTRYTHTCTKHTAKALL